MGQSWIFAGGEVPTVSRGCKRLLSRNNKYSIWRQGNKSWKLVKSERCSLIIVIVGDAIDLYSCILLPIMRRSHTCSKYKWLHSAPWIKKHQTSKISIWRLIIFQIFNVKMLRSTRTPDGSGWFLSSSKHWNYGENVGAWATHLKSCLVDKANLPLRPPIDLSCDILPANQWVYAACTSRFQVVKQDALLEAWQTFSKCIWKALQIGWLSHYMSLNIKLKETLADEINSLEGISVELQSGFTYQNNERGGVSIYVYESSNPKSLQNRKLFSYYRILRGCWTELSCFFSHHLEPCQETNWKRDRRDRDLHKCHWWLVETLPNLRFSGELGDCPSNFLPPINWPKYQKNDSCARREFYYT